MKPSRNKFKRRTQILLRRNKIKFQFETERIAYVLARHYKPSFVLHTPFGKIYVECQTDLRPEDRSKLLAVKRQNPRIDLRLLFYREVKTQIKWAEKSGFKYAIGEIPQDWMTGL